MLNQRMMMMMNNTQKYDHLIKEYKNLKQKMEKFSNEYSEKKGNMAAYEAEKNEQLAKAKSLGVKPENLKDEIEKLSESIAQELSKMNKICEELEQSSIG